jgi:hypothetical protein
MTSQINQQIQEGKTSYGGRKWESQPFNAVEFQKRICQDCNLRYFRNDGKCKPNVTYSDVESAMKADYHQRTKEYNKASTSGKKAAKSPKPPSEKEISAMFQELSRKQSRQKMEDCIGCSDFCGQFFKDGKIKLKVPFKIA